MEYSGSLQSIFKNVFRNFITSTMHKILFSDNISAVRFDFSGKEATTFIELILHMTEGIDPIVHE